jgi:hypothetical protein
MVLCYGRSKKLIPRVPIKSCVKKKHQRWEIRMVLDHLTLTVQLTLSNHAFCTGGFN